MKIAVTGASGHVGANLCRELIKQGHDVKALIHKDERGIQGLALTAVHGDITKPETLIDLCRDVEIVFHLAALISVGGNRHQLEKTNVTGTQNLLAAIRQSNVRRLIHFSSIHALEHHPLDQTMDESRPLVTHALMMYEETKAKGDQLVLDHVAQGYDAVIINPTAIVGPYDFKPSLVGQVILRLYNGSLPALVPGGYDWVDVRDIVQACIQAIHRGRNGERYILSGHYVEVKDLARMLEEVTGKKMVRLTLPTSVAKIGVPFIKVYSLLTGQHPLYTNQSLDVLMGGNRKISNDKARNELGYSPRPLKKTLEDTVTWFRENNFLK